MAGPKRLKSKPWPAALPSSSNSFKKASSLSNMDCTAAIQRAALSPQSLTPGDVTQLQKTLGNRAVTQLMQEAGLLNKTIPENDTGVTKNENQKPWQMEKAGRTGLPNEPAGKPSHTQSQVVQLTKNDAISYLDLIGLSPAINTKTAMVNYINNNPDGLSKQKRFKLRQLWNIDYKDTGSAYIREDQIKEEVRLASLRLDDITPGTVAKMLQESFDPIYAGIPNPLVEKEHLLSMLLHVDIKDVHKSNPKQTANYLVGQYAGDWRPIAACFETASKLFELLGVGGISSQATAPRTQVGITQCVGELCNEIRAGHNSIYNIKCHDHGFAVVIRNGQAELLQSYANDQILAAFIKSDHPYDEGQITNLLTKMVSPSIDDRSLSQAILFGGVITGDTPGNVNFNMNFSWQKRLLPSDPEIKQTIDDKLTADVAFALKHFRAIFSGG